MIFKLFARTAGKIESPFTEMGQMQGDILGGGATSLLQSPVGGGI